ncbi:hypothetical protein V6O07_03570, partial [Arthrospira platensis SPKY2]
ENVTFVTNDGYASIHGRLKLNPERPDAQEIWNDLADEMHLQLLRVENPDATLEDVRNGQMYTFTFLTGTREFQIDSSKRPQMIITNELPSNDWIELNQQDWMVLVLGSNNSITIAIKFEEVDGQLVISLFSSSKLPIPDEMSGIYPAFAMSVAASPTAKMLTSSGTEKIGQLYHAINNPWIQAVKGTIFPERP